MNRFLICLALLLALVGSQALSLHAHRAHAHDTHATADHDALHIHSHLLGDAADAAHDFSDPTEIDVLDSALSRDYAKALPMLAALSSFWMLLLAVLWIRQRRIASPPPLLHPTPAAQLRPAPRAPPR